MLNYSVGTKLLKSLQHGSPVSILPVNFRLSKPLDRKPPLRLFLTVRLLVLSLSPVTTDPVSSFGSTRLGLNTHKKKDRRVVVGSVLSSGSLLSFWFVNNS